MLCKHQVISDGRILIIGDYFDMKSQSSLNLVLLGLSNILCHQNVPQAADAAVQVPKTSQHLVFH